MVESNLKLVKEGKVQIKLSEHTFYNEGQVVNRDLSVALISAFSEWASSHYKSDPKKKHLTPLNLQILDGLSASGIRSLRYATELKCIGNVVANDHNKEAFDLIHQNIELNNLTHSVTAKFGDLNNVLSESQNTFDVIDLDPYGTASPFIYNAVKSIKSGGLLCVTCTDMRTFAGLHSAVCWNNYGTMATKKYCHEMALRILLGFLDRTANLFKRHITVLAAFSINFYVRVFVQVNHSPSEANKSCCKNGMIFICRDCDSFRKTTAGIEADQGRFRPFTIDENVSECAVCGGKVDVVGPIWLEALHNRDFLRTAKGHIEALDLKEKNRVRSLVALAVSEVSDSLMYIELGKFSKKIRCAVISNKLFCSAVSNAGFKTSLCHIRGGLIKTNAPFRVVWAVLKKFAEKNPPRNETVLWKKLKGRDFPEVQVDFSKVEAIRLRGKEDDVKFFRNESNW